MNIKQVEQSFQASLNGKCSTASQGMVATAFPDATHAGVEMLQRGGNAADAACAAALALCVCEPQASGIGGHTMVLLSMGKKQLFLNGSGRIPGSLNTDILGPGDIGAGHRATTIPTTIAVLDYMNRHFGCLKWKDLFGPAIAIARNGYRITQLQHDLQKKNLDIFQRMDSKTGSTYFLKNETTPYEPGDLFKQTDLALVLERLAKKGAQDFYIGDIAHAICADMAENHGFLNLKDLARIPWPMETAPLIIRLKGLSIHVPPPPYPGRGLLMMLKLIDRISNTSSRPPFPKEMIMAEIIRATLTALAGSPVLPGEYSYDRDPLLDTSYLDGICQAIIALKSPGATTMIPQPKGGETTHLSVMDRQGNSVGLTQSVNSVYGAKVAAREMGFLYNNYLVDCDLKNPFHPHFLKPSGLSVSMVCPTIVHHNGQPWIVTGSPGSDRILSTVFQFLYHVIYSDLSIDRAVAMPRLHCPPSGTLMMESARFPIKNIEELKNYGYKFDWHDPWSFYHGAIHTTLMCQKNKGFQGVAEFRRDGIAAGVS